MPGGTEDQLQNSWPCSGGNVGERSGSLSWGKLGTWPQDQAANCLVLLNPQSWCQSSGKCLGLQYRLRALSARDAGRQQAQILSLWIHCTPSPATSHAFLVMSSIWFKAEVQLSVHKHTRYPATCPVCLCLAYVTAFPSGWRCCPGEGPWLSWGYLAAPTQAVVSFHLPRALTSRKDPAKGVGSLCTPACPTPPLCLCPRRGAELLRPTTLQLLCSLPPLLLWEDVLMELNASFIANFKVCWENWWAKMMVKQMV